MNVFKKQPEFFKSLSSSSVFCEVKSHIKNKDGFFLSLDNAAAQSVFISALFHSLKQSVFVVQQDEVRAENSYGDFSGLLGNSAFLLPSCQQDRLSVPGLVFSSRTIFSRSLSSLISDSVGIFVSSSGAIKTKIRRPEKILTESLTVRVGDKISQSTIIEKLTLWEYEHSDTCLSPKTIAKRGGILDLFTEFSGHPLRLEFLGDKISSIRLFSPDTQLSEGLRTKCVLFPPVFSCARNENSLGEILESICPVVLYITSGGIAFLSPD